MTFKEGLNMSINQILTQRLVNTLSKNGNKEEKEFILNHDDIQAKETEYEIIITGYNFIDDCTNAIIYKKEKLDETK